MRAVHINLIILWGLSQPYNRHFYLFGLVTTEKASTLPALVKVMAITTNITTIILSDLAVLPVDFFLDSNM